MSSRETQQSGVLKAKRRLVGARRVEVCRDCGGGSISRSKAGGLEHGGCPTCRGTGLMLK